MKCDSHFAQNTYAALSTANRSPWTAVVERENAQDIVITERRRIVRAAAKTDD